jgi:hypothetical protein
VVPLDRVGQSGTHGDLCLTHHCALGLWRFPFASVAEAELESQGEMKATDWRVVLREGLFVLAEHFCNDGKPNVSNCYIVSFQLADFIEWRLKPAMAWRRNLT